ncbi:hypothetical protein E4U26_000389 [Claviceps purpurea]|nr:hypothetical protein E4U26_000389 [Claviceps purpurea]
MESKYAGTSSGIKPQNVNKATIAYPTPPSTPPPAAPLAGLMFEDQPQVNSHGSSKTVPWSAAFMAGTQAGNIGKHQGGVIDKAKLKRLLATTLMAVKKKFLTRQNWRSSLPKHYASSQSASISPNVQG